MRTCYHKECDSGSNPKLRKSEGIEFLAKTAQAVVLAVAELSGGIESCDLSQIYGYDDSAVSTVDNDVIKQSTEVSTEQILTISSTEQTSTISSTEQTSTTSSTEQTTTQMFYLTEPTVVLSTEHTVPQMLNSDDQSLAPIDVDDHEDQNEISVLSHPKLEFTKLQPHSKPEFTKINMPVLDEIDATEDPENEQVRTHIVVWV